MHCLLELQSGQPAPMDQCPGWPVVVMAVAQQESAQLLTGLTQAAHRRQTRTQEIAEIMEAMFKNPRWDEEARGHIRHLVEYWSACFQNRNLLMLKCSIASLAASGFCRRYLFQPFKNAS